MANLNQAIDNKHAHTTIAGYKPAPLNTKQKIAVSAPAITNAQARKTLVVTKR